MLNKNINKQKYVVSSIILSLIMIFSSVLSVIPSVNASYDYDYGYSANLYTTNWLQYSTNAQATAITFDYIEDFFSQQVNYNLQLYGEVQNWGSSADYYDVYSQINHDNTYHDRSTVLYVGHGGPYGFYVHTSLPSYPAVEPDLVNFTIIQSYTQSYPSHNLAFMWVCNGKSGGSNLGSPTAWNPMAIGNQATYGPYTWIGFSGASPWMCDQILPGTANNNLYRNWLTFFYYRMLIYGESVEKALDGASWAVGLGTYNNTQLAKGSYQTYWPYQNAGYYSGQMHVVGDNSTTFLL